MVRRYATTWIALLIFVFLPVVCSARTLESVEPLQTYGNGYVTEVEFSTDERFVAAGTSAGKLLIWDGESGELLHRIDGHPYRVKTLALSPDGRLLFTGACSPDQALRDMKSSARLWDVRTGSPLRELPIMEHASLRRAVFSDDSARVFVSAHETSLGISGTVHSRESISVWDVQSGDLVERIWNTSRQFSPTASLAVKGGRNGCAIVDMRTEDILLNIDTKDPWRGCAITRDGRRIFSHHLSDGRGGAASVKCWDTSSAELLGVHSLPHSIRGFDFAASHDGNRVAAASLCRVDGKPKHMVFVWDIGDPRPVLVIDIPRSADGIALSHDGARLFVAAGSVHIWDIARGVRLRQLVGTNTVSEDVAVTPDGRRLVTCGHGIIRTYDLEGGDLTGVVELDGSFRRAALSPGGNRLVASRLEAGFRGPGGAALFDASTGKLQVELDSESTRDPKAWSFSPDGSQFLLTRQDSSVLRWDTATGRLLSTFRFAEYSLGELVFSPDGESVLLGAHTGRSARLFELATGKVLREYALPMREHSRDVGGGSKSIYLHPRLVTFAPDGERVLVAGGDSMFLFDTDSEELSATLLGDFTRITSIAFAPDGIRVMAGYEDGTLTVWDASAGERLRTLPAHAGAIHHIIVTPDKQHIVTGGQDGVLKRWSAPQFECFQN